MIDPESVESPLKGLGIIRRKAFGVTEHGLVRTDHFATDKKLPLIVEPVVKGVGLVEWARMSMQDPRLALASVDDFQIPRCVESADEAIVLIRELHGKWQAN